LHLAYKGTNYRGWQRQPDAISVQEVLETALVKVLKTSVSCIGCGRTDAQVHASQFFAHADIEKDFDFDLIFRLNKALPPDIAIFDIFAVDARNHARFDATERTYNYFIHTYKEPFLNEQSAYYDEKFDLSGMKAATALLTKYNDYRALCISPDKHNTTICHVTSATLFSDLDGDKIRFQITANRFLRGMIRLIMSKMLDIGTGKLSLDEFESYLITKQTPRIMRPAKASGLYLSKITYPFLDIPPRTNFSSILQNNTDIDWKAV
jgi:tRNA pseudouridine38-40 synthase